MANQSKRIKKNFRLYTSSVSKKKGEVYKVTFLPDEYNNMLWKEIELSEPSDIVTIRSGASWHIKIENTKINKKDCVSDFV